METNTIWIFAAVLLGLVVLRIWLAKFLIKTQKKQQFVKEYLDILNNPQYKVKKT
jgi:hypothetical protein